MFDQDHRVPGVRAEYVRRLPVRRAPAWACGYVDASPAIGAVRRIKQPEEIDRLRAAASAADEAMLAITASALEIGRRNGEAVTAALRGRANTPIR